MFFSFLLWHGLQAVQQSVFHLIFFRWQQIRAYAGKAGKKLVDGFPA
jgi:hypothetical protein